VEAKAEADYGELTMANLRPLLRSLLADRFKLGVHRESKELPIYELIVAESGAKIQANTTGGAQVLNAVGRLSGRNQSVASFAAQVSLFVGRTVVDRTGLNGEYGYLLEWTPDPNPASSGDTQAAPERTGPSIFTALQEQLGLQLKSTKGPVEIVVIDQVERPSEN
jgi:uncharacterized protein (TIGR03435 family)